MSCHYCGEMHGKICPWIKAIEYFPMDDNFKGGGVKRVEFWSRAELDAMAIKANVVVGDPRPIGTGTGSIGGSAVGIIRCSRCKKEGHFYGSCPETIADNRKLNIYGR